MYIKELSISNFKSIKDASINFSPLGMIVGANAAGKSNLINVLRFIQDIVCDGIENAVALQGGMTYLTNACLPKGHPIEIGFVLDLSEETWIRRISSKEYSFMPVELNYNFRLLPHKRGSGYRIAYDYLKLTFELVEIQQGNQRANRYQRTGDYCSYVYEKKSIQSSVQMRVECSKDNICSELQESILNDHTLSFFTFFANEDQKELMLNMLPILLPSKFNPDSFIRIFDFDPRELKKPSSMSSARSLAEDGSNLALVLQNILRTKENRIKLTTILNGFLPFIDSVSIETNLDKSCSYKITETYSKRSFYANFLSDGTVSIIALIVALYFEEKSNIIVLEEPERNIHPKLLANLLTCAEEISTEKQVIITTHNPEFLKYANIENLLLVSRDEIGFTRVSAPKDSSLVQSFIQDNLELNDLFVQDLLGE